MSFKKSDAFRFIVAYDKVNVPPIRYIKLRITIKYISTISVLTLYADKIMFMLRRTNSVANINIGYLQPNK